MVDSAGMSMVKLFDPGNGTPNFQTDLVLECPCVAITALPLIGGPGLLRLGRFVRLGGCGARAGGVRTRAPLPGCLPRLARGRYIGVPSFRLRLALVPRTVTRPTKPGHLEWFGVVG